MLFKKEEWFKDFNTLKRDLISPLLVCFAVIPEGIAFSAIVGVDPRVGIYTSICILILTSIFGGRPALMSAATGAMALVMANLVKDYGVSYMFAATVLTGIIQIFFGIFNLTRLISFVTKPIMIGFVDGLGILIFISQIPELVKSSQTAWILCALSLFIIFTFPFIPRIGKAIPSGLIAIVIVTIIARVFDCDVRTIQDLGELPNSLPKFIIPDGVAYDFNTLKIIFPYSLSLAVVGMMESLLTSSLIDEITQTSGNKRRECFGQGIANIGAGFFGGMAGCGLVGQSMINIRNGARTRLSTFLAGVYLSLVVGFFVDIVSTIPTAVIVGIMIMISLETFDVASLKKMKTFPLTTNIVIIATVTTTIITHNLALSVFLGVFLESVFFVSKVDKFVFCQRKYNADKTQITYICKGQLFFKSTEKFYKSFDFSQPFKNVTIDLNKMHFWDMSAVAVLDSIIAKYQAQGTQVLIIGESISTKYMLDKFSTKIGDLDTTMKSM